LFAPLRSFELWFWRLASNRKILLINSKTETQSLDWKCEFQPTTGHPVPESLDRKYSMIFNLRSVNTSVVTWIGFIIRFWINSNSVFSLNSKTLKEIIFSWKHDFDGIKDFGVGYTFFCWKHGFVVSKNIKSVSHSPVCFYLTTLLYTYDIDECSWKHGSGSQTVIQNPATWQDPES
jgi:hypothetical protein